MEYKDFSKLDDNKTSRKKIKSILFKEISAFANSNGGELLIGINDETQEFVEQPGWIIKYLNPETIQQLIDDLTMEEIKISVEHYEKSGIRIIVEESNLVIRACRNINDIIKADVYFRKGAITSKANPSEIFELDKIKRKINSKNRYIALVDDMIHQHKTGEFVEFLETLKLAIEKDKVKLSQHLIQHLTSLDKSIAEAFIRTSARIGNSFIFDGKDALRYYRINYMQFLKYQEYGLISGTVSVIGNDSPIKMGRLNIEFRFVSNEIIDLIVFAFDKNKQFYGYTISDLGELFIKLVAHVIDDDMKNELKIFGKSLDAIGVAHYPHNGVVYFIYSDNVRFDNF